MIASEILAKQREEMEAFNTKVNKRLCIGLSIGNKLHAKNLMTVDLKVDTGASANVMSMGILENPKATSTLFHVYGNIAIVEEGKCTVYIHYQGRKHQCKFYITSCNDSPTLLSYESSTAIGLVATLFQIKEVHGTLEYVPS